MIKRAKGYDTEHGDWEYFYVEPNINLASGRLASCINCHKDVEKRDYVFGDWRK